MHNKTVPQDVKIPAYLTDDFFFYLENMKSLSDPENPELLNNYLTVLSQQFAQDSSIFTGLLDQLAMAITPSIRINSKELVKIDLSAEPNWADVKPYVGVHANARATITELMSHSEQELKMAVLLNHFYSIYDATPLSCAQQSNDDDDYSHENHDYDYDHQY